ncbi:MAG: hypothetical protein ACMG6E_01620 [Candidatus Roizmanbacteria bacterium]
MRQRITGKFIPFLKRFFTSARNRWIVLCVFLSIFFFILGTSLRSIVPIAIVNGNSIDSKKFTQRVLLLSGDSVLEQLIIGELVREDAKKKNVTVSRSDFDIQYKKILIDIRSANISLPVYLASLGMTEPMFKEELRTQLLIKKLFGASVQVTDRDIDDFMVKNKVLKGQGAIYLSQKIALRKVVERDKLRTIFSQWVQVQLKKARITRFI